MHVTKNYTTDGGDRTVIGGVLEFKGEGTLKGTGFMPNQAANTAGTAASLKTDLNALLTKLKDAGLMAGDPFTITVTGTLNDTNPANVDRQYNTGKIASVTESNGIITITLSEKVEDLKDFDGLNDWGVHKWLGIGVSAGVSPITGLKYNGSLLTEDDAAEATAVGLSTGYFVRWVAADLVLAGDNTQDSVDTFTLWASGYQETAYKIVIVEPDGD